MPAHNKKTNESILQPSDGKPSNCEHLFGDYILPDLLYFISFLLGFYIFRIQESEGFYALMEKVSCVFSKFKKSLKGAEFEDVKHNDS